ncbi:hypothetical protein QCA50_013820 [Cerrena zonata]|uniref:Uncharacterized protein n=1 Tax=Cerrena zonata TaxID=2478898 RepID=A0AAW0FV09_9APHY
MRTLSTFSVFLALVSLVVAIPVERQNGEIASRGDGKHIWETEIYPEVSRRAAPNKSGIWMANVHQEIGE